MAKDSLYNKLPHFVTYDQIILVAICRIKPKKKFVRFFIFVYKYYLNRIFVYLNCWALE